MRRLFIAGLSFLLLSVAMVAGPARAGLSLVRDAEIDHIIRLHAAPLFEQAGLDPQSVDILLVNDPTLNAFVAGGQKLFLHTGLLIRSESPAQLMGVIAHEAGHIAGGHLARKRESLEDATAQMIAAQVLGLALGAATGRGDAAVAAASLGQEMALRGFLSYSRSEESAADQAALDYMDRAGVPADGLLSFMEILEEQELLSTSRQDPYLRTHPLTRQRVETLRRHVERSDGSEDVRPELERLHARMRAKLSGFLEPPQRALGRFKGRDDPAALYGRAIAEFRAGRTDEALAGMDRLMATDPLEPAFLHGTRGQILFESGRLDEAVAAYRKAVEGAPLASLLRVELAHALTERGREGDHADAADLLNRAIDDGEGDYVFAWHLMAVAEGRQGNMGRAALAMAEQALLRGDRAQAAHQAERARRELPGDARVARRRLADITLRLKHGGE